MAEFHSRSGSTNPYENPSIARWLDSSEGVPEWPAPAESDAERAGRGRVRVFLNQQFDWLGVVLPGFVLAVVLAGAGGWLADWISREVLHHGKSPISPIMLAIVLGLVVRNLVGLPAVYEKGVRLCVRHVLRFGIAILGLRLSIVQLGGIGVLAVPVVIACIATALLAVMWINRMMGLPRRLGGLIAVGTGICGVSAIVATAPVIEADEDETSYAVACITIFGLIAMLTYPFLAPWLFGADNTQQVGMFLGTAIHDTSQVSGAGLMYDQQHGSVAAGGVTALDAALVTKLFRNLCMAAVIPLMAIIYHRSRHNAGRRGRLKWTEVMPIFVIGFVAMAVVSSIADVTGNRPFGLVSRQAWDGLRDGLIDMAKWCLAVSMAGVGLGTSFVKIKGLGWKPFCVGLSAAVLVGVMSFALIKALSSWMMV